MPKVRGLGVVLLVGVLSACEPAGETPEWKEISASSELAAPEQAAPANAPAAPTTAGLSESELALDAPLDAFEGTPYADPEMAPPEPEEAVLSPVAASEAGEIRIRVLSERGYDNEQQQHVVDLLEREMAYLAVKFETAQGNPVSGATPEFQLKGSSRITEISSAGLQTPSDDSGMVEFGVIAGQMGADQLSVSFGDASKQVVLNVISLKAAGYASLDDIHGALPWDQLMSARVRYTQDSVVAEFPAAVSQHHRQQVKLAGFMMPLEPEEKQKRFLLTSNPPNCFFHVPGGPAGAVEVFSDKGIDASWDPIVLEGRFETLPSSDSGVIYRLRDARVVPG